MFYRLMFSAMCVFAAMKMEADQTLPVQDRDSVQFDEHEFVLAEVRPIMEDIGHE